jgi:hypothetical protein
MAGCAGCGGCCGACGASCGGFGGGFGGFGGGLGLAGFGGSGGGGGFGGIGFDGYQSFGAWFASHHKKHDDTASPVDTQALVDPNHPDHREAIKSISHIDPEEHSKMIEWLKKELGQVDKK